MIRMGKPICHTYVGKYNCFRAVRGSTSSQVAVTVTSYHIAVTGSFFAGQSPD